MTGPLLRSGSLTAFHPLGAVGHPVYLAAAQLRAAIARRLGPAVADTLAIPQRSEDGDHIDWYAPKPGRVVPWSVAGPDERVQAQAQLFQTRERIEELGRAMLGEADAERQVFGRLLAQVTNFPDEEHLFLVDDRPVVTFWGFVRDRASVGLDPLVNLDRLAVPPTPPATARRVRWWWFWLPVLLLLLLAALYLAWRTWPPASWTPLPEERRAEPEAVPPPAEEDRAEPEVVPPSAEKGRAEPEVVPPSTTIQRRTLHTTDGGVVTHDVIDAQSHPVLTTESPDRQTAVTDTLQVDTSTRASTPETTETTVEGTGDRGPDTAADTLKDTTGAPDGATPMQGPDAALDDKPSEVPSATAPESETSPGLDTETTPADAPSPKPGAGTKAGDGERAATVPGQAQGKSVPGAASSLSRLSRGWRTATSLQDPKTGLPIQMEYRTQDGQGQLRLQRSDGSVCETGAAAAIQGGKLALDSSGDIRCADGTNFGQPKIECAPGKDGKPHCQGRYPNGAGFSIEVQSP